MTEHNQRPAGSPRPSSGRPSRPGRGPRPAGGTGTGPRPGGDSRRRRGRGGSGTGATPAVATQTRVPAPPVPTRTVGAENAFVALGVPGLLAAVLDDDGVTSPFPIQEATLPDALAGRDILGQGRTGSGKTIAFALPLIARLGAYEAGERRHTQPRGLVLVPTRELATQVAAVISSLAAPYRLRVTTVFGGVSHGPQRTAFRNGVDIVVACPGRLLDHMTEGDLRLDSIEITVLDEADHMADQGFLPTVKKILDKTPKQGQRMLFSATLAGGVDAVVTRYLTNPVSHSAGVEAPVLLDHRVRVVADADRIPTIIEIARTQRVVIFTRTKHRARQLAKTLTAAGVQAVDMHGNLSQGARERNLAAFTDGSASALVATDIAARGIHVDEVPLVIHADPPVEDKAYTHRSGRTARAGAAGQVLTIATIDQVSEVRTLLRRAGVTAVWEGIEVADRASSGNGAASRPAGGHGRGGAPSARAGGPRRQPRRR